MPILLPSELFSSNYLQIGQHVVLLHIQILLTFIIITIIITIIEAVHGLGRSIYPLLSFKTLQLSITEFC